MMRRHTGSLTKSTTTCLDLVKKASNKAPHGKFANPRDSGTDGGKKKLPAAIAALRTHRAKKLLIYFVVLERKTSKLNISILNCRRRKNTLSVVAKA